MGHRGRPLNWRVDTLYLEDLLLSNNIMVSIDYSAQPAHVSEWQATNSSSTPSLPTYRTKILNPSEYFFFEHKK